MPEFKICEYPGCEAEIDTIRIWCEDHYQQYLDLESSGRATDHFRIPPMEPREDLSDEQALRAVIRRWPTDTPDLEISIFTFEGEFCRNYSIVRREAYCEMDEVIAEGSSWRECFSKIDKVDK